MPGQPGLHRFDAGKFLPQEAPLPAARVAQTAWERWEMASFTDPLASAGGLKAHAPVSPVPKVAAQTDAAAREVLRQQAQQAQQAVETGMAEGRQRGHDEGHAQGYEKGLAEGRAAGLVQAQAQAAQLQALACALPVALRQAEAGVADDLLALALDMARQVLGQALAVDPLAMLAVVRELLQAEPSLSGAPQLLLHPDDAALVKEWLADELKAAGWRVRTDAGMARGGCRVLAASGERDATLPTRWERVSAALARQPVIEKPAAAPAGLGLA